MYKYKFRRMIAIHHLRNYHINEIIHDLKSPIAAISGYLDLLKLKAEPPVNSGELARYCSNISEGVEDIHHSLEYIQMLQNHIHPQYERIEHIAEFDIGQQLNTAAKNVRKHSGKNQSYQLNIPYHNLEVRSDSELTKLLIYTCLFNATKLATENSDLEIGIHNTSENIEIKISCARTGFPVAELLKTFEVEPWDNLLPAGSPGFYFGKFCANLLNVHFTVSPTGESGISLSLLFGKND